MDNIRQFGMTFNNWNKLYHSKGREKGGTEFLKDQLMVLQLAIENAEQLDQHYSKPDNGITHWNYKG